MKFSVFPLLRASAIFCFLAALGAAQQTTVLYDASTYEQKRPTMAQTLGNATNLAAVNAVSQPLDADLTAIAGLTSAANKLPYFIEVKGFRSLAGLYAT